MQTLDPLRRGQCAAHRLARAGRRIAGARGFLNGALRRLASIGLAVLLAAAGDPATLLTGGSSRAWVVTPFVRDGAGCRTGEVMTFDVTHGLSITRCRDGRVVQSQHSWGFDRDGALDLSGIGRFQLRIDADGAAPSSAVLRPLDGGPDQVLVFHQD